MMKRQILIAENREVCDFDLSSNLRNSGYVIVGPANCGLCAIRLSERYRPDLAIIDIGLKGNIDAIILSAYLYERLNIPVVFLSGESEPIVFERAALTHPYGYIIKPSTVNEVETVIDIALRSHGVFQPYINLGEDVATTRPAPAKARLSS